MIDVFFYVLISSVKWGHLENLDPNSIFHNYYNLKCELVP